MRSKLCLLGGLCIACWCNAQTTVAPTPDPVGPIRGDDVQGYNIVNSFETGYRLVSVSGNEAKYRSDENFHNGIRLFNSFLSVDSKTGRGGLFDNLVITTNGLGGDPQSAASLRLNKNRLYEYTLLWRANDYYNPGLTTDGGNAAHLLDTTYTIQDHDLTLFPQSNVRFFLGYSRNSQGGAGLSTVQVSPTATPFDSVGDVFPLFVKVKRVQNDYRLGGEVHWLGFVLNAMRGWEDYKDDTPYRLTQPVTASTLSLDALTRTEPNHGTSPYWRVALFRNAAWFSLNSRFTYTAGSRAFFFNESAFGSNRFGALANQQILSFGNARRPVATGNVNVTITPSPRLTVTGQGSVYNVRTEGDSTYLQFGNSTQTADFLLFQFLKIRTLEGNVDASYKVSKWLDVHGGYEYSDRRIAASPQFAFTGDPTATAYIQTNILHAGDFGFRLTPVKGLVISADDEVGSANRPFTPKSDKSFNALSARIQYKYKTLQVGARSSTNYNANSISLTSYSSHVRTNSVTGSWVPRSWFSVDASYSKLHVDSLGGIAFFANTQFLPNQVSYYVSNIHAGSLSARLSYKRIDFFAGYSRVQDTGDGRGSAFATTTGPNLAAFQQAQTFPLKFDSPSARISVRLHERLRWNLGYQYYGYFEDFFHGENYHANTGFTSLLWSF